VTDVLARFELSEELSGQHHNDYHVVCTNCGLVPGTVSSPGLEAAPTESIRDVPQAGALSHRQPPGTAGRCGSWQ
jgi:hypothetical protein